jgi:peptidoglycan/xylan/chitin deacetylase (PgdA/CDA1 family)
MKHATRDSIVLFFTYSGIAWLYRWWKRRRGPLVRVIGFHDVVDKSWFEALIKSLKRDMHILSPNDFAIRKFETKRMNILVTFDDGYESWIEVCAPVLKRYSVTALFFVNSKLVVSSADQEAIGAFVRESLRISPKRMIGKEGVDALLREGHTIGGHTASHMSLRNLSDTTVRHEVESDKYMLEETFGAPLEHFAYPFGTACDYSERTDTLIHNLGYPFVYTAEPGFYSKESMHIPRTLIENEQSYASLRGWLMGGYDLFSYLKRTFMS